MKRYRCVRGMLSIVVMLAFAGCSSVTIKQPLPRAADAEEMAAFEGEWVSEGQVVYVRFGTDGTGRFAAVDWKDNRFRLDEGELVISKGRKKSFLSARMMEDGKWPESYYFAQYRFDEKGDLVLYPPDVGAFADAVSKKVLEGSVDKGSHVTSVFLTASPEKVLAFLNSTTGVELFDSSDPMILKKLVLEPPKTESQGAAIPNCPND